MTVRQLIVGVLVGTTAVCFAVSRLSKPAPAAEKPLPSKPTVVAVHHHSDHRVALVRRRPALKKHPRNSESQLSSRKLY